MRRSPNPDQNVGSFFHVNREGNALINEAIIGTGFKDRFSMDVPFTMRSSRTLFWSRWRQAY